MPDIEESRNFYIGIDPGSKHPAIAIIYEKRLVDNKGILPILIESQTSVFGTFDLSPSYHIKTLSGRIEHLRFSLTWENFTNTIKTIKTKLYQDQIVSPHFKGKFELSVIQELPSFERTLRGQKAAETGALVALSYSAGFVYCKVLEILYFLGFNSIRKVLKTPIQWKGNVPKHITKARMCAKYDNISHLSEDEIDAIGLADHLYETIRRESVSTKEAPTTLSGH